MDYEILLSSSASDLEAQVRAFIANGWKPQGGVAVSNYDWNDGEYDHQDITLAQAMVKEA